MKKYNVVLFIMLLAVGLISCEDTDRTPIVNQKALDGGLTFHLNTPTYANLVYSLSPELADAPFDTLTCAQPEYGFSTATVYTVQVGFDDQFTDSTQFRDLPNKFQWEKMAPKAGELNMAIVELYGETATPEMVEVQRDVYVRLKALPVNFRQEEGTIKPAYSNAIKLQVKPYYVKLKPADPKPYFIIGLADGNWNNSFDGIGTSVFPMNLVDGFKYDKETGAGEFEFVGYFEAARSFKLIRDLGSWGEQWGNAGAPGIDNFAHNDGGSSNLQVPADGYYKITLNSITNTLTIDPVAVTPKVFASIGMIGDINGWSSDIVMTKVDPANPNNHVWYTTYTFDADAAAGGGVKFRADGDWADNWGGKTFPFSSAPAGDNIMYKAGTYIIIFNDISGTYYFFEKN